MDERKMKLSNDTILEVGKTYRWSGYIEFLYHNYTWIWSKCKITRIDGDKVFIYDYNDNKEYEHTNESLQKIGAKFVRNNLKNFLKIIFNK